MHRQKKTCFLQEQKDAAASPDGKIGSRILPDSLCYMMIRPDRISSEDRDADPERKEKNHAVPELRK